MATNFNILNINLHKKKLFTGGGVKSFRRLLGYSLSSDKSLLNESRRPRITDVVYVLSILERRIDIKLPQILFILFNFFY